MNAFKAIVIVIGALIYTLSPIDLVPDVLPILGWLDDIGVIALAVKTIAATGDE